MSQRNFIHYEEKYNNSSALSSKLCSPYSRYLPGYYHKHEPNLSPFVYFDDNNCFLYLNKKGAQEG